MSSTKLGSILTLCKSLYSGILNASAVSSINFGSMLKAVLSFASSELRDTPAAHICFILRACVSFLSVFLRWRLFGGDARTARACGHRPMQRTPGDSGVPAGPRHRDVCGGG